MTNDELSLLIATQAEMQGQTLQAELKISELSSTTTDWISSVQQRWRENRDANQAQIGAKTSPGGDGKHSPALSVLTTPSSNTSPILNREPFYKHLCPMSEGTGKGAIKMSHYSQVLCGQCCPESVRASLYMGVETR